MNERVFLVGSDMTIRGDDAIVEGLVQLSLAKGAELHVLHVLEPSALSDPASESSPPADDLTIAGAIATLRRRVHYDAVFNGLPCDASRLHVHVRVGPCVETLLQAAIDLEADMLILGTHGKGGSQHLLLGSVAQQLLRRAHCPVLIARPKNYHGLTKTGEPRIALR